MINNTINGALFSHGLYQNFLLNRGILKQNGLETSGKSMWTQILKNTYMVS